MIPAEPTGTMEETPGGGTNTADNTGMTMSTVTHGGGMIKETSIGTMRMETLGGMMKVELHFWWNRLLLAHPQSSLTQLNQHKQQPNTQNHKQSLQ